MLELTKRWQRFKKWFMTDHDHYQRATLITWLFSAAALAYLIITGQFFECPWVVNLFTVPAFLGGNLSGSTYTAYMLDPISRGEKRGNGALSLVAVAATIAFCALGFDVPFADSFGECGFIAYGMFGLTNINWLGGLGYRTGSQFNTARPENERITMRYAGLLGAALGVTLFVKAPIVLTALGGYGLVPGIALASAASTIATGGIVLGAIVAGFAVASLCKSCADYCSKAVNYARYRWGKPDSSLAAHVQRREAEYRGAFVGVLVGATIGIVVSTLLVPALPFIAIGLAGAAAAAAAVGVGALIMVACVAAVGSICSKSFKYFDRRNSDPRTLSPKPSMVSDNPGMEPKKDDDKPAPSIWQRFRNMLSRNRSANLEKTEQSAAMGKYQALDQANGSTAQETLATASTYTKLTDRLATPSPSPTLSSAQDRDLVPSITTPLSAPSLVITPPQGDCTPVFKPISKHQPELVYPEKQPPAQVTTAMNDLAFVCANGKELEKMQQQRARLTSQIAPGIIDQAASDSCLAACAA